MKSILIILLLYSTKVSAQDIQGYYHSNFAIAGYSSRQMEFLSDSSFRYEFVIENYHDWAAGRYKISQDTIYLLYFNYGYKEYQTLDTINATTYRYVTKIHRPENRPLKLIVKSEGLFIIDYQGKLITAAQDKNFEER